MAEILVSPPNALMIFVVGGVVLNWWVWFVPDCDFQKVEGMWLGLTQYARKLSSLGVVSTL